jgi:hypothetical protein
MAGGNESRLTMKQFTAFANSLNNDSLYAKVIANESNETGTIWFLPYVKNNRVSYLVYEPVSSSWYRQRDIDIDVLNQLRNQLT